MKELTLKVPDEVIAVCFDFISRVENGDIDISLGSISNLHGKAVVIAEMQDRKDGPGRECKIVEVTTLPDTEEGGNA